MKTVFGLRTELLKYFSVLFPLVEIPTFIFVFIESDNRWISTPLHIGIPVLAFIILNQIEKGLKNGTFWLFSTMGILHFGLYFTAGPTAPAWLMGITAVTAIFALGESKTTNWLTVGYYLMLNTVSSYLIGRTLVEILLIVLALTMVAIMIERSMNYILLQKIQVDKQKEEIESQNEQLLEQHDLLEKEKNKTQQLFEKVETMFGQDVSKEVVDELVKAEGEVSSKSIMATILFLDIRDFTSFADSRQPAEVASFQNIVFSDLISITRKHRGIVNQILGDGIMATFGAPAETTTHAGDAVNAGFEMLKTVAELGERGSIPNIRLGIGGHSGKVLAGNIGNEVRKQYSLTGTTVIIAARLEQLNKQLESQFLISDSTYQSLINPEFKARHLGDKELKGIGKKIGVFQLA